VTGGAGWFIVGIRLQFFANDAEFEANYVTIIRPGSMDAKPHMQ